MKYITLTAMFDDMDTAEACARNITHSFPAIKSIRLHARRENVPLIDRYSSASLTAANQRNYTNVAFGVVPPQGVPPLYAMYGQPSSHQSYVQKKVKMTVTTPCDKKEMLTSCMINGGGHFVKTVKF